MLLEDRLAPLRSLTFSEVSVLPEAQGESVDGFKVTTFHQRIAGKSHLVTVQVAKPRLLGLFSSHWERGLVFVEGVAPREATREELIENGG